MSERVKLAVLLSHLNVVCKHYQDDQCYYGQERDVDWYHYANCDGDVSKCTLSEGDL